MTIEGRNMHEAKLIKKIINSGNKHVFHFWNELSHEEKYLLIKDINKVDLKKIKKYYKKYIENKKELNNYSPPEVYKIEDRNNNEFLSITAKDSFKKGEIAYLTVAGGQATRLNYNNPKGCFPITPVNHKSLFQIFAEKIKFISGYYSINLKWYIMTSESNYLETKIFFIENEYFNINKNDIIFFQQNMIPTLTLEGKLILSEKNRLHLNPDGHGGTLKALLNIGLLNEIKKNGIKYLYYFQVDNPLINLNDTHFIGYHINKKSMISTKVIKKNDPFEKLGCIVNLNGNQNSIIEYSDFNEKQALEKDESNNMKFSMGSIGIHLFNVNFLFKFTKKLPIHYARKQVKGYKLEKNNMTISEFESIKFETFVFDVINFTKKSIFFECNREDEFSPLKNKTGSDSIETCKKDQIKQHLLWLEGAGFINDIEKIDKNTIIEISPLYSPDKNIFLLKAVKDSDNLKNIIFEKNGNFKNEIYIDQSPIN